MTTSCSARSGDVGELTLLVRRQGEMGASLGPQFVQKSCFGAHARQQEWINRSTRDASGVRPTSRRNEISVSATKPVQRQSVVSVTFHEFTLAVSARLMPVTHRPLLARAPKPVRSPESRWPQGLEILVSGSYRSGSSARISRVSAGRLRSSQDCANRSPLSRSVSTLHQRRNPAAIVCANRVVTTTAPAGSDDAHDAPAIKGFRWLAQVTTPRDGLPDPSSSWTAQRGPSSCPLPAGSVQRRAEMAPLRALGQWLTRWTDFQQESAIDANAACRGGKQQNKRHKSGVVSRVPCRSRHA